MLRKIYSSTLKELLRSPVTIISCLFLLVYFFFCHSVNAIGKNGIIVPKYGATIYQYVCDSAIYIYIAFTVILTMSFLYHERNSFHDMERVTLMKMHSYLIGKALAYLTFYYIFNILLLIDIYYSSYLTKAELFSHAVFPFWPTLQAFCICYFYITIPLGIFTVGFIMALSGISKSKPIPIIAGVFFYMITSRCFQDLPFGMDLGAYYYYSRNQLGDFYSVYKKMSRIIIPPADCLLQSAAFLLIGIACFLLLFLVYAKREKD